NARECFEGLSESVASGCDPKLNRGERQHETEEQVLNGRDGDGLPAYRLRFWSDRARSHGKCAYGFANGLRRRIAPELAKEISREDCDYNKRQRYHQQLPEVS